jgi:hypothetical protein
MSPAELGQRFTSREISDYKKLREIDPWGEEREDLRQALNTLAIVQAIASLNATNQSIANKKRVKPTQFELESFHVGQILQWGGQKRPKRRQTQKEMLSIIKMIAGATKAKVTIPGEGYSPNLDPYGGPAIKPHDPNYKGEG